MEPALVGVIQYIAMVWVYLDFQISGLLQIVQIQFYVVVVREVV